MKLTFALSRLPALVFLLAWSLPISGGSAFAADVPLAPPALVAPAAAGPDSQDLETAIKFALEHNYSILEGRERIRAQEGLVVQVSAQERPSLVGQASYSSEKPSLGESFGFGFPVDNQNWSIGLVVQQVLYAGGGITAGVDNQRLNRDAALLDLRATINNALLDVRTKYYNVIFTAGQIEVQEKNVALLDKEFTDTQQRFNVGTVSQFEVLRAKVEKANAQPALITAKNNHQLAIDQLRQSLGFGGSATGRSGPAANFPDLLEVTRNAYDLDSAKNALSVPAVTYDLQNAIATARNARPELQRLAKLVDAGDAGVRVAQAGSRPTLTVQGGYELAKNFDSNSFSDSPTGWTVGVQGSWAIFDEHLTEGKVATARSQRDQARLSLLEQTLAIEVQVRTAISSLDEAGELRVAANEVVGQAVEAQRLAGVRRSAGTATDLDVTSADTDLVQAQNNELQAEYSYIVALATLRAALGEADVYAPGN
jgi:outer membrane protein TolC